MALVRDIAPIPRDTFVSPTTERILEMVPAFMRRATDIQGTFDAIAAELDRFDARRQDVLDSFFPQTASEWLGILEAQLGLAVDPPDKTIDQRRNTVQAFLQNRSHAGEGSSWVEAMNRLLGTGWEYEEHIPGDVTSPPPNTIRVLIPYSQALAEPTGLGATAGGAGTLAVGTYHYVVTARNFYGETLPSPEAAATLAAPGRITLDWSDVAGATGYRVYRALGAGAFERVASPTASTYVDNGSAVPDSALHPPGSNTTQSPQASAAKQLARQFTHAHIELEFGFKAGFLFDISAFGDVM